MGNVTIYGSATYCVRLGTVGTGVRAEVLGDEGR